MFRLITRRASRAAAAAIGALAEAIDADDDSTSAGRRSEQEEICEKESLPSESDNDLDDGGGGKDGSANVNHRDQSLGLTGLAHDDDPFELRQGPSTVIHPHSPRGHVCESGGATPRILNGDDAPIVETVNEEEEEAEEEEEVRGPNYNEWEGVPPNPFENHCNFNDCPFVGEEEDEPEDDDSNPTEWKATEMRASHFRYFRVCYSFTATSTNIFSIQLALSDWASTKQISTWKRTTGQKLLELL